MAFSYPKTIEKKEHGRTFPKVRMEIPVCLFLMLLILIVYWQVRNHEFVSLDDNFYVTTNPHVITGLKKENIIWAFSSVYQSNWHPLTWISHMLDVSLYGLDPGRHHLTNVFIHILNTLLLFMVLRRMTNDLWKSSFVAALFALHPLHVESVAWVSERKDVLCAFFWFLCMWSYDSYAKKPCFSRYMPILLFFSMGVMSKPMIVSLPFSLLLLDYWPLERFSNTKSHISQNGCKKGNMNLLLEKAPLFVIAIASCVVTYFAQKSGGSLIDPELLSFGSRINNALVSYFRYAEKAVWPHSLCVLYPLRSPWHLWQTVSAAVFLTAVSAGAFLNIRKFPYFAVGWLWYLGTLVPVIGLVQAGKQAMADRYTYIPSIGLFIIFTWGMPYLFSRWRCRKWIPATVAISILAVFILTARLQVLHWANSIVLFEQVLKVSGNSYLVHNNLGNALARRGRFDEAVKHYSEALRISPSKVLVIHNNLGAALVVKGRYKEAIVHLQYVLEKMPNHANAQKNLEQALKHIKKGDSSTGAKK
jgi:protein O-mannosyl-transferase